MQIKVPKGIVKQGLNLAKTGVEKAAPVVGKHSKRILGGLVGALALDNLRMRVQKRKDRKAQEKKDNETQAALRKNEAKIHDLEVAVSASEFIQGANDLAATNAALQQVVQQQDDTIKQQDEALKKLKKESDEEEGDNETQEG